MATVKLRFRPSTLPDKPGTLFYQITDRRLVRLYSTEFKIYPSEWDNAKSEIIIGNDTDRQRQLLSIKARVKWDMERILKVSTSLTQKGLPFTTDDIVSEFQRIITENTLFNFMESVIARLVQLGKVRTSETYRAALRSFKQFRTDEDVLLECISPELMENYQAWLKQNGLAPNTISFYMRILRAVYNRAVEKGITEQQHPFKHVYTGLEKTVKRAISLRHLKKIKDLELAHNSRLDFARDIFMFSFYTRGMSFIDIAYLRKSNINDKVLSYRRHKTGQLLHIRWEPEMQEIVTKWSNPSSDFLLTIITNEARARSQYIYQSHAINNSLKEIAKLVGLTSLSLYAARHSWASIAKEKNVPISVISEGMGHDNETTTQIYLASLSTAVVDKANSMIIKSL